MARAVVFGSISHFGEVEVLHYLDRFKGYL